MSTASRPHGDAAAEASTGHATLIRDVRVAVLNCSASGCLLEVDAPLAVGTVASLTLTIDGRQGSDAIEVVRCQPIAGAGGTHHVGARFLWADVPGTQSIRSIARDLVATELTLSGAGLLSPVG